jgi:hypothetical protein
MPNTIEAVNKIFELAPEVEEELARMPHEPKRRVVDALVTAILDVIKYASSRRNRHTSLQGVGWTEVIGRAKYWHVECDKERIILCVRQNDSLPLLRIVSIHFLSGITQE